MIKEKSCGIVLFNRGGSQGVGHITQGGGEPRFLLLHYPQGHWDFPKGHVEAGEDEAMTARRELFEETGISDAKFHHGFCEKIHYLYKHAGEPRSKDVFFFLAETSSAAVKLSHEHKGFEWLNYEDAHKKITFNDSRRVLAKAHEFLRNL